jgi:hypothetical protein
MTAMAWSRVRDWEGRPGWPLGVSARAATLRAIRSLASACRMAFEREVPHAHRGGGVPGRHGGQRLPDVGGSQVAELAGSDDLQDRLQDVLVLRHRFGGAAVQAVGEPVLGGLPECVVGVAGLRGDALVELVVQVPELVDDGRFGGAADLAAGPCAVAGVPGGEFATPQARAASVAVRVAAGAAVLEGDAVLAVPAPGRHG